MRIGINGKPAFEKRRTGIEEYTYQLLKQWALNPPPGSQLKVYTKDLPSNIPGSSQTLSDYFNADVSKELQFEVLKAARLWTQIRLGAALLRDRPDVFFNPMQILPRYTPRRSIVTVHDLGYEYFPESHNHVQFRYLSLTTKDAVRRAKAIIAVSESTRNDLITRYRVPREKIVVVHHGFTLPERADGKSLDQILTHSPGQMFDLKQPYFLFLGRLERRKNIETIIRGFEILKFRHLLPHQLILAGHPGFGYEKISEMINSSPARKDIHKLGHVQGQLKFSCLGQASALVLISLYEGFGLPVLEAQAMGVPVVASLTSSLPEVGGRGAIYIEANDEEALADNLYKLVTFPQFRLHHIQHGYDNVKRFNWRSTAEKTWEVIEEVGRGRAYFV